MTITKDVIEKERAALRDQPNTDVKYTINGPIQTAVHSTVKAENTARVNQMDRTMHQASENLANNMAFKAREGYAKAQFEPKPVTPKYHERTSPQLREASEPKPRPGPKPKQRQGPTRNRPARSLDR